MENIVIHLGYIHPVTDEWHNQIFADVGEARDALRVLARHHIPVMYARFTGNNYPQVNYYGCTEDEFIDRFIRAAGEYDVTCSGEDRARENYLVWYIEETIVSRLGLNEAIVINGHKYDTQEMHFTQDPVTYAYSGYEDVGCFSIGTADTNKLNAWLIDFYWKM